MFSKFCKSVKLFLFCSLWLLCEIIKNKADLRLPLITHERAVICGGLTSIQYLAQVPTIEISSINLGKKCFVFLFLIIYWCHQNLSRDKNRKKDKREIIKSILGT